MHNSIVNYLRCVVAMSLNLGVSGKQVVNITFLPLYHWGNPWYPLHIPLSLYTRNT